MRDSKIEWCHHTFNPWEGCTKVSEACKNCYAEALVDHRFGRAKWGRGQARRRTSNENWRKPLGWNRKAARHGVRERVFCASLADVFDAEVPHRWRADLWTLIRETPNLDWLLLTKRPRNIAEMVPVDWGDGWPNVWLGTTAENQRWADERLPLLLEIPAVVRFVSCEPMLEAVNFRPYLGHGLDWVIVGGESGAGEGSRRMHPEWARSLRDQSLAANVAFHFKQWGDYGADGRWVGKKKAGRTVDGRTWDEFPNARTHFRAASGSGPPSSGARGRGRAVKVEDDSPRWPRV